MVDAYTKMKPDSFKLQAVLTAYYEDINGFRAPEVAPRPRLSSADSRNKRTLEQRPRTRLALRMRATPQQRLPLAR